MLLTFSPFLANSLLFLILIWISIKDLRQGIIPDVLLMMAALLGFLQWGFTHCISVAILSILSYSLYKFYPFLKNQEWLGFGDVKMMTISGLWLDISQIPLFLMIGGGLGVGMALFWRVLKKEQRFPFGPALAMSLIICNVWDKALSLGENKMTITFTAHTLQPASGLKPDSVVILIHGYGANGEDLLSLGSAWAAQLPNTLFVAPDGPDTSDVNPSGNQWFGLGDWAPNQPFTQMQRSQMVKDIQTLTPSFNTYLDEVLKTHGLPPEKLALVGFSQGGMVALHLALHRPQCAGVIAYSGAFLDDPKETKIARPPVLLIHGLEDQLLPPFFSRIAEEDLKAMHVPVTLSLLPGLEHGIDGRGLGMGAAFLKEHLYKTHRPEELGQVKENQN
jgi:phospholipase/carboxylesterase